MLLVATECIVACRLAVNNYRW